ncbi:maleylpyruvate isomerase N-terminal domain-containing protein [Streptomyces sp. NPDC001177]
MSLEGMVGLRATIDDVRVALPSLSGDEWAAPSAATGWSVKDVGTHMADLLSLLMSAVRGESGERCKRQGGAHVNAAPQFSAQEGLPGRTVR